MSDDCLPSKETKLASAERCPADGEVWTPKEVFEDPPLGRAVLTYVSYLILYAVSLVSDFLRRVGLKTTGHREIAKNQVSDYYAASS